MKTGYPWYEPVGDFQVAKNTLYVAVKINDNPYDEVAFLFNSAKIGSDDAHADTSYEQLQAWLRQRIRANPDECWLILSGTVLAETSAPPVSFTPVR